MSIILLNSSPDTINFPVSISGLETFPMEPVDSPVLRRRCISTLFTSSYKYVLAFVIQALRQSTGLSLVVVEGECEPLVKGDSAVVVLVDLLEQLLPHLLPARLVGTAGLVPPLVPELR